MANLRIGITGYGLVGKRRHQVINALPGADVVAISDIAFDDIKQTYDGISYYRHHEGLFNERLDALFVCLPNNAAPNATIAGLENDLHVFCEKPPGRTVGDIRRVIHTELEHPNSKLKYGFNHRYHGSVQDALNLIRSGDLGTVLSMRGVYGKSAMVPWPRKSDHSEQTADSTSWRTSRSSSGGGILLDQGIHMVDLMRVFGGEFTQVMSIVKNTYWNHDVEDNAYALMSTEDGVVAMLHSTATQWRHTFGLEIALTEGALKLSGILSGTRSYGEESLTAIYREDGDDGKPREQTTTYVHDFSWRDEIIDFFDSIKSESPISVGHSADALASMELVYRIYCADAAWSSRYSLTND